MDIKSLFGSIATVAEKVAASIFPGATEAIEAGKAVLHLADTAKATFAEHDPAVLNAAIDNLRPLVNAHVDAEIAELRG
jgi:hypothetical protein